MEYLILTAPPRRQPPVTRWLVSPSCNTATVVMRLVEQDVLALEDRLVDRLPDGVVARLHVLEGVDRTGEITASRRPDLVEVDVGVDLSVDRVQGEV